MPKRAAASNPGRSILRQGGRAGSTLEPRRTEWPLRLAGSLFGLAAGLIGLFSLLGPSGLSELERERAAGFGVAALVVGAVALLGSLATRDVRSLWYCSPRRWRAFRADLLDDPGSARAGARRPLRPKDDLGARP